MSIRRATEEDKESILDTLELAFADDPFAAWLVGPGPDRATARRRYFEMVLLKLTLPHGEVYLDDRDTGAALWAPPGTWQLTPMAQVLMLPRVARVVGMRRMGKVLQGVEQVEGLRPPPPWYLLALIGTRPESRRQGVGSALLAPVLSRCDEEGVAAVLETSNQANVAWYMKHGFQLCGETQLPEGPPCWSMVREPRIRSSPIEL